MIFYRPTRGMMSSNFDLETGITEWILPLIQMKVCWQHWMEQ